LKLENLSKSGSYVVRPMPPPRADPAMEDRGDGEDSDATADDMEEHHPNGPATAATQPAAARSQTTQRHPEAGPGAAPPLPALSLTAVQVLRSRGLDPNRYRLEPIWVDQTGALTELDEDGSFAIVQCGKADSTLVLSRRDIVVPIKAQSLVDASLLASVGGRFEPDRFGPCTHAVAKKYNPSATMLAAWCRGVELVAPDYVSALAERTAPTDPMPEIDDYRPAPGREEDYWFLPPPSWDGWAFVVPPASRRKASAADETVEWMRSVKATILEVESASDLERIVAGRTDPKESAGSVSNFFAMAHKNWITKAQLEKFHVVVCDLKTLASRLTSFQSPDGSPIVRASTQSGSVAPPQTGRVSEPGRPTGVQERTDPPRSSGPPGTVREAPPRRGNEDRQGGIGTLAPTTDTVNAVFTAKRTAAPEATALQEERGPKRRKHTLERDRSLDLAGHRGAESDEEKNPSSLRAAVERGEEGIDADELEGVSLPSCILAKPDTDRWLSAAGHKPPPGRGGSSSSGGGGASLYSKSTAAVTGRVREGFLLQVPLEQNRASARGLNETNASSRGVDYRGFRKNAVLQAENYAAISLVSVTPKETEAAIHMEAQRHQIEERQRMAEDLFRDPEFPGGRARLRR
jgi:hypothetical protein